MGRLENNVVLKVKMRDGCGCLAISKLNCRFYLCSECSIPYTAVINILVIHISFLFVGWAETTSILNCHLSIPRMIDK